VNFEGKHLRLITDTHGYEYIERVATNKAVGIVAVTSDYHLVLIKQHRIPLDQVVIEIPAGLVGDEQDETVEEAAHRELLEETGYKAGHMQHMGDFTLSPGMSIEIMSVMLATDLERIEEGGGDDNEKIEVITMPLNGAHKWLKQWTNEEQVVDIKVLVGLQIGMFHVSSQIARQQLDITSFVQKSEK